MSDTETELELEDLDDESDELENESESENEGDEVECNELLLQEDEFVFEGTEDYEEYNDNNEKKKTNKKVEKKVKNVSQFPIRETEKSMDVKHKKAIAQFGEPIANLIKEYSDKYSDNQEKYNMIYHLYDSMDNDEKKVLVDDMKKKKVNLTIFKEDTFKRDQDIQLQESKPEVKEGNIRCKGRNKKNVQCTSMKVLYYQRQTRGADEPMTTFYRCCSCDYQWSENK